MADEPEQERRRLAAMLPGADVARAPGDADSPIVEMVALVTDVDRPIPVLVERGGYEYPVEQNARLGRRRVLLRVPYRLTLTTDRGDFERARTTASGSC